MSYLLIFDLDTTSTSTAITRFRSTIAVINTNETKYIKAQGCNACIGNITVSQLDKVITWINVNKEIPKYAHLAGSSVENKIDPIAA